MFKEGFGEQEILSLITKYLPWDVPEWLAYMIFGFLAIVVLYVVVKVGDIMFKIVVVLAALLFVYLLLTGRLSGCGSVVPTELQQAVAMLL